MSGSQPLCAQRCLRGPSLIASKHRRHTLLAGAVASAPPAIVLARKVLSASAVPVKTRARAWIATEAMQGKIRRPPDFDVPLLAGARRRAPRRMASVASEQSGSRPEPETAQIVK